MIDVNIIEIINEKKLKNYTGTFELPDNIQYMPNAIDTICFAAPKPIRKLEWVDCQ